MCTHEVVGDYYRGCKHFHPRFLTGQVTDCNISICKTSQKHIHRDAPKAVCDCPEVVKEERKVENLYQFAHDDCKKPVHSNS